MKREERKDILDRALDRLGNVPPGALVSARERIRRHLKTARRPIMPLPPLPDATPASLWALRRPLQVTCAAAVCLLIAIGAVIQWSPTARHVSKTPPESASLRRGTTRLAAAGSVSRFMLLPPGDGKIILDRACGGCHRATAVGTYRFVTKAEYAALVSRMVGKGAPVSQHDADVLVDYLFDNVRIKPEPPVGTASRAVLERACTSCHSLNGIEKYAWGSEGPYRELVSTMISYGAILSDEEKTELVQYLFATYGKR